MDMGTSENVQPEMKPSLESLLAPLSAETFLSDHWPGQPAVIRGAVCADYFSEALPTLMNLSFLRTRRDSVMVLAAASSAESRSVQLDPMQATRLFDAGMSIVAGKLQDDLPLLGGWIEALRRDLGLPRRSLLRSIAYLSPAGAGVHPHWDLNSNFSIQLSGTKRWTMAPNSTIENPLSPFSVDDRIVATRLRRYLTTPLPEAMPEDREEFLLEPGDLLFIPRGYLHGTEAVETSLSLNFTLGSYTLAELVADQIRDQLWQRPEWRAIGDIASPERPGASERAEEIAALLDTLPEELASLSMDDLVHQAQPQQVPD